MFSGTLHRFELPLLLRDLERVCFSGSLELRLEALGFQLGFNRGNLLSISTDDAEHTFSTFLLRHSPLGRKETLSAIQDSLSMGMPVERLLQERDQVSREDLLALRLLYGENILMFLYPKEGLLARAKVGHPVGGLPLRSLRLDHLLIFFRAVAALDDPQFFASWLKDCGTKALDFTSRPPEGTLQYQAVFETPSLTLQPPFEPFKPADKANPADQASIKPIFALFQISALYPAGTEQPPRLRLVLGEGLQEPLAEELTESTSLEVPAAPNRPAARLEPIPEKPLDSPSPPKAPPEAPAPLPDMIPEGELPQAPELPPEPEPFQAPELSPEPEPFLAPELPPEPEPIQAPELPPPAALQPPPAANLSQPINLPEALYEDYLQAAEEAPAPQPASPPPGPPEEEAPGLSGLSPLDYTPGPEDAGPAPDDHSEPDDHALDLEASYEVKEEEGSPGRRTIQTVGRPGEKAGSRGRAAESLETSPGELGLRELQLLPPAAELQSGTDQKLEAMIEHTYGMMLESNHYGILGVDQAAALSVLRQSYRRKKHQYSYERYRGFLISNRAGIILQLINKALDLAAAVTLDRRQRQIYDHRMGILYRHASPQIAYSILFDAEDLFTQGKQRMKMNHWFEALRAFERACEINPEEPSYHAYRGWAMFHANQQKHAKEEEYIDKVMDTLDRALYLSPDSESAMLFKARIQNALGNLESSIELYTRLLKNNPGITVAREELRKVTTRQAAKPQQEQGKVWDKVRGIFKR